MVHRHLKLNMSETSYVAIPLDPPAAVIPITWNILKASWLVLSHAAL